MVGPALALAFALRGRATSWLVAAALLVTLYGTRSSFQARHWSSDFDLYANAVAVLMQSTTASGRYWANSW